MKLRPNLSSQVVFATTFSVVLNAVPCFALDSQTGDNRSSLTSQAVELFRHGKLDEAQQAADKAIQADPKDWLAHETMSFLQWQAGNITDAVAEGQKAIIAAPHNAVALTNLGHIYQQVGDYKDAITLYERASKEAPNDWVPRISLARSYVGADNLAGALNALSDMTKLGSENFAWHYQIGLSYLIMGRPADAVLPLQKAQELGTSQQQKAAAAGQLLIALLKTDRLDDARTLLHDKVLTSGTTDGEVYVRAAAALLSPEKTEDGTKILESATKNLTRTKDSDTMFRLGSIYEQYAAKSSTTSGAWLGLSADAFRAAIALNPGPPQNHLALAAILTKLGKPAEAAEQLDAASLFAASDPLTNFVKNNFAPSTSNKTNIQAIEFVADGLSCGCQSTRIDTALRGLSGVALLGFSHIAPYSGVLLFDSQQTSPEKIFDTVTTVVFPDSKAKPTAFKISQTAHAELPTLDSAVTYALSKQFGDVLSYQHKFDPIAPLLPEPDRSARGVALTNQP